MQPTLVHYLPILTTVLSAGFAFVVFQRYRARGGGTHLLWWTAGIVVYGMGTFAEGWMTVFGWSPAMFKFWYIVGALLGGAPLAQGTVWLILRPRTARVLSVALVAFVAVAAIAVIASPIDYAAVDPFVPTGRAFEWQWVRGFSPFINTYAVIFLIGGAAWSAWRFYKAARVASGAGIARDRFLGNVLIALGAILPGIGGGASRLGHTEVLYLMELIGIMLIWSGYWFNVRKRPLATVRAGVAAVLALTVLLPSSVVAQQVESRQPAALIDVRMNVVGPGGQRVTNAAVRVRTPGHGAWRALENSSSSGLVVRLAPGVHEVRIEAEGLAPWTRVLRVDGAAEAAPVTVEVALQLRGLSEQVTVAATKTAQDVARVPGEVVVIGRDRLDQVQARSLEDALRYEPGVDMSESPRRLGQTPNIRGFDDQRVLTVKDGARVAQFNSGHRGTLFFDIDEIETIEVVKGPASALYGSGAIGGVLALTTREPGDLLRSGRQVGAQVHSAYSSAYDELQVSTRLFGRLQSGLGYGLSYTVRRNDGTVRLAGTDADLAQAEEDIDAWSARVSTPVGVAGLLRVSFERYGHSGVASTNLALAQVGASELVDRKTANITGNARYSHRGDAWWNRALEVTAYLDESDIDEIRPVDGRVDDIRYRTLGFEARNSVDLGQAQTLTYGVEVIDERQEASRNDDINAFFPSGDRLLTGVYAQDQISLAKGRLQVIPGLRWDRWESRPDDLELGEQTLDRLSPKLGVTYELSAGLFAAASYGEGFRAPFFQELFLTDVHFAFPLPGNRFFLALFLPNAELLPEKSRNVDLGLRYRRGDVSVRGAIFRADVRDFIELLPIQTGPFPPPGGLQLQLWQALNRSDARLEGVEGSLEWAVAPDWFVRAGYTRVRGEDRASGEPLLQVPADKLVAGIEWSRPDWGTRVSWITTVRGDRDRVPTGVEPTAGYTLHDLHMSWSPRVRRAMTLHLSLNNLADRAYENARFGTPGVGRDIRFGVTVGF